MLPKLFILVICSNFFFLRAEEVIVKLNNITIEKLDKNTVKINICTSYPWILYYQKTLKDKNNRIEIMKGRPVKVNALDLFTFNVEGIEAEKTGFFILVNTPWILEKQ